LLTRRAAALVVAAVSLGACTAQSTGVVGASQATPLAPIPVERQTITATTTVDVVSLATPEYVVVAPSSGELHYVEQAGDGASLREGTVVATVGTASVTVPVDSTVVERLLPEGMRVQAGVPVLRARYGGFAVSGVVSPEDMYRLAADPTGARVQLEPGPAVQECRAVSPPPRESSPEAGGDQMPVLCLLPDSDGVVADLPGVLAITTGVAKDVLTLPLTAVAGSVGTGVVTVADGDRYVDTPVELGITNGIRVEITSGLDEGDLVLPYGPDLLGPAPS